MIRALTVAWALLVLSPLAEAAEVRGIYLETRTCQVYTGPCFANGEMGLAGRDAIMAWHIEEGQYAGAELADLSVVMIVRASHTLGFQGLDDAAQLQAVVLVDDRAEPVQREALIQFAREQAGKAGHSIVRISSTPISMSLDTSTLQGKLTAGKEVELATRKARPTDCICSNEVAFYPPLAKVENFAPGVTTVGEFRGRGLGSRWSTPESRSAYMATFHHRS